MRHPAPTDKRALDRPSGPDRHARCAALRRPVRRLWPAVLACVWVAFSAPPPRAEPVAGDHPLNQEERIGLETGVMLREAIGFHEDEAWEHRLASIGYRVAAVTGDTRTPFNFQILDLPEPNAMALPGGFIFITRGMLESGITDDELAHLIGHEIAHVHMRHFARSSRLSSLLSVLQTALMVGVLVAAPNTPSAYQRVEVSDDPGLNEWSVGMGGKEALLQGTTILGSVFRALFERGYSRKLEFEADDVGSRLAVKAGFAPEGGPGLMQRLHERSYEGNRFSYWRTHPFFGDRISRARIRMAHLHPPEQPPDDTTYRQSMALFLASAADNVTRPPEALYLYRCALQVQPGTRASLSSALEMVRFKSAREERKHSVLRTYGPIIAEYDTLLARAAHEDPTWSDLAEAEAERFALEERRRELEPEHLRILEGTDAATDFLERFLLNYPDHPRAAEMTCRLGLHYLLSERPGDAISVLEPLADDAGAGMWADSARVVLLRSIEQVEDLVICYELLERSGAEESEVRAAALARMEHLVAADVDLDRGGRFLQAYPQTPWNQRVREEVWREARSTYENGRVLEGLHRRQEALDAYFVILALAPDSPAADQAEASIDRIHRLESANDY